MPLTLKQRLLLLMYRIPARTIISAMKAADKAGCPAGYDLLVGHHLAGGDVIAVMESAALLTSRQLRADSTDLMAIDLAGRDVRATTAAACSVQEFTIQTLHPKSTQPIARFFPDGTGVRAAIQLRCNPSPFLIAFGGGAAPVHAQLAATCQAEMAQATTMAELLADRDRPSALLADAAAGSQQISRLIACEVEFGESNGG